MNIYNKIFFTAASLAILVIPILLLFGKIECTVYVVLIFLLYSVVTLILNVWFNKGDS